MKMILICMKTKLHAERIFALRLVLKQRHKRTLGMAYSKGKYEHLCSPNYLELTHFTSPLYRERQRNVQRFIIQPFVLLVTLCVCWRSRVAIAVVVCLLKLSNREATPKGEIKNFKKKTFLKNFTNSYILSVCISVSELSYCWIC